MKEFASAHQMDSIEEEQEGSIESPDPIDYNNYQNHNEKHYDKIIQYMQELSQVDEVPLFSEWIFESIQIMRKEFQDDVMFGDILQRSLDSI